MQPLPRVATLPNPAFQQAKLRSHHWRFFRIVFVFTYLGIILDVATTALGSSVAGSYQAYEQNPLGGALIGQLGWLGILAGMTALMLVAYVCLRMVHTRVRPGWIRLFNWLLLVIGGLRWLAVVTALMYIAHSGV